MKVGLFKFEKLKVWNKNQEKTLDYGLSTIN